MASDPFPRGQLYALLASGLEGKGGDMLGSLMEPFARHQGQPVLTLAGFKRLKPNAAGSLLLRSLSVEDIAGGFEVFLAEVYAMDPTLVNLSTPVVRGRTQIFVRERATRKFHRSKSFVFLLSLFVFL